MLTKDLLRVSRRGGGYHPQFAPTEEADLAERVIAIYRDHVGRPREDLTTALSELERGADDYKLVRGFAKLLDREATFDIESPVEPQRAREVTFEVAERMDVVTHEERTMALSEAADSLNVTPSELDAALFADLDERQVLRTFDPRWDPEELVIQYNLSLAMTAMFDAIEVRIRSSDPRTLVSTAKWLGLMYDVRRTSKGREVVLTGPDALFRATRRYGTRFARLLRTVVQAGEWHLEATIDDRGSRRTMQLSHSDPVRIPGTDPVEDVRFDSGVEASFATRFESLDLDWELVREPEPLAAGNRVMIPDFAFDYKYGDLRVFFEVMGFWTPEYVEKKLDQLRAVEEVELLVAVDESLGVGETVEAQDHRVIDYRGSIRLKDVRNALREYEERLIAESAADLPQELVPEAPVVTFTDLARKQGVSEGAIETKVFPEHERVGRTLVRPSVLTEVGENIEPGMSLADAASVLEDWGIDDASAALSALGYRVEWEGLGGGTIRETADGWD